LPTPFSAVGGLMAVPPPDLARLAELGADLGLSDAELAEFAPAVTATFASSDAVEALYRRSAPTAPTRDWQAGEHPLNAWAVTTEIRGAADGPLAGRTVAIKDNVSVAGVPMANGSATVEGFVPTRDATTVRRLLDAGAVITGKAVCEDLCFSGASFTSKPHPVRNPWDPARNAGGSSSGSAALVATGEVDLALGGDQGGSVRIPSSFCGTVGHKPSGSDHPHGGRRRPDARRPGRSRRAGPAAADVGRAGRLLGRPGRVRRGPADRRRHGGVRTPEL
jgi:amidase